MKLLLAGGGTGGHFYPAIAVYQELKSRFAELETHYIAVEGGIESRQLPVEYPEILVHKFKLKGLSRPLYNPKNTVILLKSFIVRERLIKLLKTLKPDLAFLTGGYICGPVGSACKKLEIPFFIHEQNFIPGITNRLLARKSSKVFLSFEESIKYLNCQREKIIISGNPVRKVKVDKKELLEKIGFNSELPFIVIMGGSRGSEIINKNMLKVYEILKSKNINWQFVHSTGDEKIAEEINRNFEFVRAFTFVNGMIKYISIADAMVSRAGATAIAEILTYKVPSVLIPWPYSADNHQHKNAEALFKKGLSSMIVEKHLTSERLFEELWNILVERKGKDLKHNLSKVYLKDPSKIIVESMLEFLKAGRR